MGVPQSIPTNATERLQRILQNAYQNPPAVNFELIKTQLEEGANIDTTQYSSGGLTALTVAAMAQDVNFVTYLLQRGANVLGDGHYQPLFYAHTVALAEVLVAYGAPVSHECPIGLNNHIHQTLFHDKAEVGLVGFYMQHGIQPFWNMGYYHHHITDKRYLRSYLNRYANDDNHKKKVALVEQLIHDPSLHANAPAEANFCRNAHSTSYAASTPEMKKQLAKFCWEDGIFQ